MTPVAFAAIQRHDHAEARRAGVANTVCGVSGPARAVHIPPAAKGLHAQPKLNW